MACSQIVFARERPEDAGLLLTVRRDDLLDGEPGAAFGERLDQVNVLLRARLSELTIGLQGSTDQRASEAVARAVVELPNAALRRHAREGAGLPVWLEEDVAEAVRRLLVT